jgi:endonuclease/exonuclease/phosphatase family metal-dependent hydrolase
MRRFKGFAALAALFLVIPASAQDTLMLGAWNIEHLGFPGSRSGLGKNIAQAPLDIAAYIASSDVDILALEEIGDDDNNALTRTSSTLNQAFALLNAAPGQNWTYVLFPKRQAGQTTQLTGLAWNQAKVQMVGQPFQVPSLDNPSAPGNEWDRSAHAVQLTAGSGKSDIVIVPVHMKSNIGTNTDDQRAEEARLLTAQLSVIQAQFSDDDIVILGDTNCLGSDEEAISVFVTAGFTDLNVNDDPTTFKGPAPFDRILVTASDEFTTQDFDVIKTMAPDDHKKRLSDHYMVVTTVTVGADVDASGGVTPAPVPVTPPAAGGGTIRIARLLPNPDGSDEENETVTVSNSGSLPVDLDGWILRDKVGTTWNLQGILNPGSEIVFVREGQQMALNNNGDTIELVDGDGTVRDTATYTSSTSGVEITFDTDNE